MTVGIVMVSFVMEIPDTVHLTVPPPNTLMSVHRAAEIVLQAVDLAFHRHTVMLVQQDSGDMFAKRNAA